MKLLLRYKFLIIIVFIAAVLRFWQLGSVPPSPDWDEAALGYNAYAILKTGRDEYGIRFPLVLRSFDDYKPPLYAYLAIPAVSWFGPETWVVRLPSAAVGTLAVASVYFLVKGLLVSLVKRKDRDIEILALLASALLALSPWHIQFSRIAFEANIGVTLNILGVVFFVKGLKSWRLMGLSALIFGLGLYAYHSERIFVPLLVVLLAWVYRQELWQARKALVFGLTTGIVIVVPLVPVFLNQNTLMRLRGTSSLADQTGLLARSVHKLEQDRQNGNPWGVVFDNRRIVWAKTVIDGYLSHFSLRWLFLTGDNDRHHAPSTGLLYLWELPFLLWGMYVVARKGGRFSQFIFGWFLLAPVPASPTSEVPHAIRTLVFLPTFQIFVAFGIYEFWQRLMVKRNILRPLLVLGIGTLILFNIFQYLDLYFNHLNLEFSRFWQYGYKQAVDYTIQHRAKYKKIIVSTKLEQPHMFFLYYLKYDPQKYLTGGGTASGGFAEKRNRFDIYEFRPIEWDKEVHDGSVLYIGTIGEIAHPLVTINYLDGSIAMRIGE